MSVGHFLTEVRTSTYYRRHPLETLRYARGRRILSPRRTTDPMAFLASFGLDAEASVRGIERWLPALRRAIFEGKYYQGYPTGTTMEVGTALYGLVRALQPEHFVEAGVAAGVSSSFISAAMIDNGHGTLHSIELPPEEAVARFRNPADRPGRAIPEEIRRQMGDRHVLVIEDVRTALPTLLRRLGKIDVFFHDDFHVPAHMSWEFETVWPHIRPGGALLADNTTLAWVWFCRRHGFGKDRLDNLMSFAAARKPGLPQVGVEPAARVAALAAI